MADTVSKSKRVCTEEPDLHAVADVGVEHPEGITLQDVRGPTDN